MKNSVPVSKNQFPLSVFANPNSKVGWTDTTNQMIDFKKLVRLHHRLTVNDIVRVAVSEPIMMIV